VIFTVFVAVLTVFSLVNNIQIVFTHLYYVPIIIAAYWFGRNGDLYAVLMSAFYLSAVIIIGPYDMQVFLAAVMRAVVFIGISLVIAILAITTILKKFEGEKTMIFLDSVNAMLIHSSSSDLTKFIHFIISKLRIMNIAGILLAVEKGLDPVLLSQLTTFADDLIEFPEEKTG